MVQLNVRAQVCSNAVTLFLLTASLFYRTLACHLPLVLYALLFQAAVTNAHLAHEISQSAQAVLVYRVVGKHSVAVYPDEAVAKLIVVLDRGNCFLGLCAYRHAEVGQHHIVLRLFFKIAHCGSGVVDPRRVQTVVAHNVTHTEHRRCMVVLIRLLAHGAIAHGHAHKD